MGNIQDGLFSKTCQQSCPLSMGRISAASSTPRRVGASHKDGNLFLLSSILEDTVPERFSLSPKACQGILRRAEKRGKELPQVLKAAMERQANV